MRRNRIRSQKGMATIEFTGVALVLMVVAFGIVEFGSLILAQAVVTNVTREGGSLASRDLENDEEILEYLVASTSPLNFSDDKNQYKIYIATIEAGDSANNEPNCIVTVTGDKTEGTLDEVDLGGHHVVAPDPSEQCDLPDDLWGLLTYDENLGEFGGVALSQLTVVKIYYHQEPLTPLVSLLDLAAHAGGTTIYNYDGSQTVPKTPDLQTYDSFLISSKAIF